MRVLVIDIGGSNVKFVVWGTELKGKFASWSEMTPGAMVRKIKEMTGGWRYHAVSIGFPGLVINSKAAADPPNLGTGWAGFRFQRAFKKPVRVINDAAMQALGSYEGGRMLFLGLGTGLGSTLILDDVVVPLELADLPFRHNQTAGDALKKEALEKNGLRSWKQAVHRLVPQLAHAFRAEYVVLGGGNVRHLRRLPKCARRGHNGKAFAGGARLWGLARLKAKARKHTYKLV